MYYVNYSFCFHSYVYLTPYVLLLNISYIVQYGGKVLYISDAYAL